MVNKREKQPAKLRPKTIHKKRNPPALIKRISKVGNHYDPETPRSSLNRLELFDGIPRLSRSESSACVGSSIGSLLSGEPKSDPWISSVSMVLCQCSGRHTHTSGNAFISPVGGGDDCRRRDACDADTPLSRNSRRCIKSSARSDNRMPVAHPVWVRN